jgi:hypothetical protein
MTNSHSLDPDRLVPWRVLARSRRRVQSQGRYGHAYDACHALAPWNADPEAVMRAMKEQHPSRARILEEPGALRVPHCRIVGKSITLKLTPAPLRPGEMVRVYWNLHRGRWSIQAKRDGHWRVLDRRSAVSLEDATWKVSAKGRERVRREQRKVVHAFAEGRLMAEVTEPDMYADQVRYNPFSDESFHVDGIPVTAQTAATFTSDGRAFIPTIPLVR